MSTITTIGLKIFRASTPEEMPCVRPTLMQYHAESRYSHIVFSEKKFEKNFIKAINNPANTLIVYVQHKGKTVGLLHAGIGDYYLGEGGIMVTVYGIYTSADVRSSLLGGKVTLKLIRAVTDWAKANQANELHIHSTSGIEPQSTGKFLNRLGFKTYGGNYVVRVG